MHLLYFINSLAAGGAESSLAALAGHYAARGIRLDVAYLNDRPGLQAELEQAGATLFCLSGSGGRLGWLRRGIRLARARRPDLIHTTLFEADLVGRIAGAALRIPVVSSLVNTAYGAEQLDDPGLRSWRVRGALLADAATARAVTRFHAVSTHVADVMSERLRIPSDRIDAVPRGRDPSRLGARTPERAARARMRLGVDPAQKLVLAAARQERQKGLDILIKAFPAILESLPSARLVIAGREGGQTPVLEAAVHRLGLEGAIDLLGPRSDLPDLLCAADVFVFPSRWEGLPGAVLEAMALEAPIVASDIPPVREAVADRETALLVPVEAPDALASAVIEALDHPVETAERARRARARFLERFTIDRIAEDMIAFYERTLSSRRAPRR